LRSDPTSQGCRRDILGSPKNNHKKKEKKKKEEEVLVIICILNEHDI
jgi:hypothetical protein